MTYQEQLLTPEWKAKRQEVIDYYWGYCIKCMSTKRLEVHHKYYIDGRMAWEYPMSALEPLCHGCHSLEHDKVPFTRPIRHIREIIIEMIGGIKKYAG